MFCLNGFIKSYQCHIQQFFGGAGFSTTVARRKTIVQLVSLGWCCKPSPVGSRGKTLEIYGYFAFSIAQNIALLALQQGTLMKLTPEINTFERLRVWVWNPNQYTGFKIALDMALAIKRNLLYVRQNSLPKVLQEMTSTWKIKNKYEAVCFKGYLCYKTITSQNVSFEAQVKNFFIL